MANTMAKMFIFLHFFMGAQEFWELWEPKISVSLRNLRQFELPDFCSAFTPMEPDYLGSCPGSIIYCCVTLGKLLDFSMPQFPFLWNGNESMVQNMAASCYATKAGSLSPDNAMLLSVEKERRARTVRLRPFVFSSVFMDLGDQLTLMTLRTVVLQICLSIGIMRRDF